MDERRGDDGEAPTGHRVWVHEAELALNESIDPRAVGAAVTVALCGHWEHEGPCRWPHNNQIDGRRFRTVFVCEPMEEPHVRALIRSALRGSSEWRVVSDRARPVAPREQPVADALQRAPRRPAP